MVRLKEAALLPRGGFVRSYLGLRAEKRWLKNRLVVRV